MKSFLEQIAPKVTSMGRIKEGDVAGYGPFQIRASGDGWMYYTEGDRTPSFHDEKHGDLELEVLKARISSTKDTLTQCLAKSGYNPEDAKANFVEKIREQKLDQEQSINM